MYQQFWIGLAAGFLIALALLRWVVRNDLAIKFVAAKNAPKEMLVPGLVTLAVVLVILGAGWGPAIQRAILNTRFEWWVWALLILGILLVIPALIRAVVMGTRRRQVNPPAQQPSP